MSEAGFVYVLINPSLEGLVKIGRTQRDPADRAKELSAATGVPTPFYLAYKAQFEDSNSAELYIHERLIDYRLSKNKEFFKVPLDVAIEALLEAKQVLSSVESGQESIKVTGNVSSRDATYPTDNLCQEFQDAIMASVLNDSAPPGKILEGVEIAKKAYEVDCLERDTYCSTLLLVAGWMLDGNHGFFENPQEALILIKRAADLNFIKAYQKLGDLYAAGEKVRKDLQAARQYYWEGVKLGDNSLWVSIADTYEYMDLARWQKAWNNYFVSEHFLSSLKDLDSMVGSPVINAQYYLLGLDKWRYKGQLSKKVNKALLRPVIERAKYDTVFRQNLLGETDDFDAQLAQIAREGSLSKFDKHGDGYTNSALSMLKGI